MNPARALAVLAICFAAGVHSLEAQDLSRYRAYVLESSLDTVLAASGMRIGDTKIRHERPARIRELEWRRAYIGSDAVMADPVQTLTFLFFNDALFQITADYDPARIEGLSVADMVATVSATYGAPVTDAVRAGVRRRARIPADLPVLAAWENPTTSVLLLRSSYSSGLQLVLVSKALGVQADNAITQAQRLDAIEAPRRESDRRKQEAADDEAERLRMRDANKAAFRP